MIPTCVVLVPWCYSYFLFVSDLNGTVHDACMKTEFIYFFIFLRTKSTVKLRYLYGLKPSRYPSIREIEGKILKNKGVGTCKSLWHIQCIRDISVRDIGVQLYWQMPLSNFDWSKLISLFLGEWTEILYQHEFIITVFNLILFYCTPTFICLDLYINFFFKTWTNG